MMKKVIFAIRRDGSQGALAQLARAPRWQRGGHQFESDMLHKKGTRTSSLFYWQYESESIPEMLKCVGLLENR